MIKSRRIGGVLVAVAIGLSAGCTDPGEPPSADVAILVLDHFSAGSRPSPSPKGKGDERAKNCPTSGLPTNEVGSGGGGSGLPRGVSHGKAVYDTVAQELDAQGNLSKTGQVVSIRGSSGVAVWEHHIDKRRIILVGVDIAAYDTDIMAGTIKQFIDNLRAKDDLRIAKFVLNMSFVIVPCDLRSWWSEHGASQADVATMISDFRANIENYSGVDSLKTTLDDLTQANETITVADLLLDPHFAEVADIILTNLFLGRLYHDLQPIIATSPGTKSPGVLTTSQLYDDVYSNDPWRTMLKQYPSGGPLEVIPVGAAGNGVLEPGKRSLTRFDFPFAPALWNSVISVSAGQSGLPRPVRTAYSNSGEFMLAPSNVLSARGTSFAAPHLSALEALYLLNGGKAKCGTSVPTLGYADSDNQKFSWDDSWLDPAAIAGRATQICPDFAMKVTA